MAKQDKEVTEYIKNASAFAQPILKHWRKLVLDNCKDVEEAIKYSIPHYNFNGDYMLAMAAYSKHCSFTFFKSDFMSDSRLRENKSKKPIDRFLGKVRVMEDLPSDKEFISMLKEAMKLNEAGVKVQRTKTDKPKDIAMPDYFLKRLKANPAALSIFDSKSPSYRKNYLQWITDAKTEETRNKRLDQSMEWISEGKDRFWQFKK